MAGRPEKHTADYFPFFVKDGRTLFVLETQYGATGTGVFTNVMRFLCSTPDHHFSIGNPSDRLFFFSKLHIDEAKGMEMLGLMVKTGKLDGQLFNHQIIYCQDLINSIQEAYRKRENEIITKERVLQFYGLPAAEKELTAEEIELARTHGDGNTQRREEKRKEEKKKVVIDDETWLKALEENPVYRGLEVRVLYGKMMTWCEVNGKRPTRRRFVNWLNREDKPVGKVSAPKQARKPQESPTLKCERCGEEYDKADVITVNGAKCCPKCPEAREYARENFKRLMGSMGGLKGMDA